MITRKHKNNGDTDWANTLVAGDFSVWADLVVRIDRYLYWITAMVGGGGGGGPTTEYRNSSTNGRCPLIFRATTGSQPA